MKQKNVNLNVAQRAISILVSKKAIKRLIIIAILSCVASTTQAATIFTDWTSVNTTTEIALGTLSGIGSVTFTGGDLVAGVTDGTSTKFDDATYHTPALPFSDNVGFFSTTPISTFTFTFGSAVTDPIIHLVSLASSLTFDGGVSSITKISGDPELLVSSNVVTGGVLSTHGPGEDAHGTIRLDGTYTSFSFDAFFAALPPDGITIQLGYEEEPAVVPEPSTYALLLTGLIGLGVISRWKKRTNK